MANYEVHKTNVVCEIKTPDDIVNFLAKLGEIDSDFCGDNGNEYLWDDAKKMGCTSNADYLAKEVVFNSSANVKKYGLKAYGNEFAKRWLKRESYYKTIDIAIDKIDIPERTYTDNLQGTYVGSIVATYEN